MARESGLRLQSVTREAKFIYTPATGTTVVATHGPIIGVGVQFFEIHFVGSPNLDVRTRSRDPPNRSAVRRNDDTSRGNLPPPTHKYTTRYWEFFSVSRTLRRPVGHFVRPVYYLNISTNWATNNDGRQSENCVRSCYTRHGEFVRNDALRIVNTRVSPIK